MRTFYMQFACMLLTLLIKKKTYSSSLCRGNVQTQIIKPSLVMGFRYTTFIFNLRKVVYRKQLASEDEILIPDQTQSLILKAPIVLSMLCNETKNIQHTSGLFIIDPYLFKAVIVLHVIRNNTGN